MLTFRSSRRSTFFHRQFFLPAQPNSVSLDTSILQYWEYEQRIQTVETSFPRSCTAAISINSTQFKQICTSKWSMHLCFHWRSWWSRRIWVHDHRVNTVVRYNHIWDSERVLKEKWWNMLKHFEISTNNPRYVNLISFHDNWRKADTKSNCSYAVLVCCTNAWLKALENVPRYVVTLYGLVALVFLWSSLHRL